MFELMSALGKSAEFFRARSILFAAPCVNVVVGLAAAIDADIWNGSSVPKL
ncbi:hypothetical protein SCH4B_3583 [Ruegeria sp. TrichCH4B]|nr:hypothetical protein SCH4B_3583 [Ruegeria sp. TrichCH4B]